MSLSSRALVTIVVGGLLAGCGGSSLSPSPALPQGSLGLLPSRFPASERVPVHGREAPATVRTGIYVSEFSSTYLYGYPIDNRKNAPATCNIYVPNSDVNDIAVDGSGNVIIPTASPYEILIYKGKKLCGPWAATITDPYGQPTGAASNNAIKGTIAVANIFDNASYNGGAGSISLCTMKAGCTQNLGNPNLYAIGGVAMDLHGDCWASGETTSYTSSLIYFAGCTGSGVAATGFAQTLAFGALDIDKNGNLVVISVPTSLYVYKGCKPKCKLLGGPFTLEGSSTFGHLNEDSTSFAVGDYQYSQVDIYSYRPTSVTYRYSFNNGLTPSQLVEGAAYDPRSKE